MDFKRIKQVVVFLVIVVTISFLGYLLGSSYIMHYVLPPKDEVSSIYLVYIFLAYFLVLAIHELGHLLTGLAYGFRFELFVIGFFGIKRNEKDQIQLYLNKDINHFGGIAATSPQNFDSKTIDQFANVVLAGPLASLILSLFGFITMFISNQPFKFIFFCIGVISFLIFCAVTIPSKTGVFYTDRKRYQRLKSNGLEKDIEIALFKTMHAKMKTNSLEGVMESELLLLVNDELKIMKMMGNLYLCEFHKDNDGKFLYYKNQLLELLKDMPKTMETYCDSELKKLRPDSV